jgi:hypothetical protein
MTAVRSASGRMCCVSTRWWRTVSETGLPAEHQQGHELAAIRYCERNRAADGPADLLFEEYDVTQRQLRGNLPQAFVHAPAARMRRHADRPASRRGLVITIP